MVDTNVDAFNKTISGGSVLDQVGKRCSRGKCLVTQEPKDMTTALYKPAKAGCMRLMAVDKSKYLSRFAQRVFFLHVKSTAASGQKREARWRTRADSTMLL